MELLDGSRIVRVLCVYSAYIVRVLCVAYGEGSCGKYAKMTEKMTISCKIAIFLVILHDF